MKNTFHINLEQCTLFDLHNFSLKFQIPCEFKLSAQYPINIRFQHFKVGKSEKSKKMVFLSEGQAGRLKQRYIELGKIAGFIR